METSNNNPILDGFSSFVFIIAEYLNARLIIVQRCQFTFVCLYVPYSRLISRGANFRVFRESGPIRENFLPRKFRK